MSKKVGKDAQAHDCTRLGIIPIELSVQGWFLWAVKLSTIPVPAVGPTAGRSYRYHLRPRLHDVTSRQDQHRPSRRPWSQRSGGAAPRTPGAHQQEVRRITTRRMSSALRAPGRSAPGPGAGRTASAAAAMCARACGWVVRRAADGGTGGRQSGARQPGALAYGRTSALAQQPLLGARPTWNSAAGAPAFVSSAHESLKAGTPSAARDRDS